MFKHLVILFLDLDGVINSSDLTDTTITCIPGTFESFQPPLCSVVNQFINQHGFKVVLSTAWRNHYTMEQLKIFFKEYLKIDCEIIDKTSNDDLDPNYYKENNWDRNRLPRERGLQITQWLEANKHLNVKSYFILDDSLDASYGHCKHYFRVNNQRGFDELAKQQADKQWLEIINNIK